MAIGERSSYLHVTAWCIDRADRGGVPEEFRDLRPSRLDPFEIQFDLKSLRSSPVCLFQLGAPRCGGDIKRRLPTEIYLGQNDEIQT